MSICTPAAQACDHAMRVSFMNAPPYVIREPGRPLSGSEPELLGAILAQAGCRVDMLPPLPRRRRQLMFLAGDIDLIMDVAETPERAEQGWFTPAYRSEVISLFSLATPSSVDGKSTTLPTIHSFDDVISHGIGLISQNLGWFGTSYAEALPRLQQAHLITPFENMNQGLTMLKAQRGELLMANRIIAIQEARRMGIALRELPWSPSTTPVRIWLSKKSVSEADATAIGNAVQTLEERGVLKTIRTRWGLQ